ncbi:MAG: thioesterase family protein [Candidatus Neomarinimicrobiota bacterium]
MIAYQYHTRVFYRDVDQMGVVYYSRYLEYFEAARTELLRSYGLNVTDIESRGFFLPVLTSHCEYHSPARFEEELVVHTVIPALPRARLRIEYQVRSRDGVRLHASGYTEHCFTDRDGRAVRPPQFFLAALRKMLPA